MLIEDNKVIGGWIGTMRGNLPIAKIITKSVYFDSYPIFATDEMKNLSQDSLITSMKLRAKRESITMFNLTHWVRGRGMQVERGAVEGVKRSYNVLYAREKIRCTIVPYNEKTLRPFLQWLEQHPSR